MAWPPSEIARFMNITLFIGLWPNIRAKVDKVPIRINVNHDFFLSNSSDDINMAYFVANLIPCDICTNSHFSFAFVAK